VPLLGLHQALRVRLMCSACDGSGHGLNRARLELSDDILLFSRLAYVWIAGSLLGCLRGP
jgi:hypothetical protein